MLVDSFLDGVVKAVCPPDHTYKLALFTGLLNPAISSFPRKGEWKGEGYAEGGATLTGYRVEKGSLTFNRVEWLNADISARCGLIYDATTGQPIKIMDFKRTVGVQGGLFEVKMPPEGVLTFGGQKDE